MSAYSRTARAFRSLYILLPLALTAAVPAVRLPQELLPAAPFPAVRAQDLESERIAPGVERATYRLLTAAGPLVVSLVTADLREPTVRLGAVLANDRIVSKDETTSSMARRTGAVAGINGDYFDIGASGAPVGMLVRDGALLRTPSARAALTVGTDRALRFGTYRFAGTVGGGAGIVPLTGVNEWPPQGGAVLLTPAFGTLPPSSADATLFDLAPLRGPAGAARYRVAAVTTGPPWPATAALRLAYGPAARALGTLPDVGDVLQIAYDTDPPLASVATAVGGGPLLLQNGLAIDDPLSPNYADRDRRIPAAAAARFPDGTLALLVVDGRHPATSIGVNRAELIALLRALGATDAMLLDSGGSATLVARLPGDEAADVVNAPSDGIERPVADGLFVYSDAPVGPPAYLVVRPARIIAVPGAHVALRARIVDAALHAFGDARGAWDVERSPFVARVTNEGVLYAGNALGAGEVRVRRGSLTGALRVETIARVSRIVIGPPRVNPDPQGTVMLTAEAFDARDRPVAIDGVVRWSAKDATIERDGRLTVAARDALVTASAGGTEGVATVPVGRHESPLALFDDVHRAGWSLAGVPPNTAGSSALEIAAGRLQIAYDFGAGARAVSANATLALGAPLAISCAIDGDGGGEALRATLSDRYGERQNLTFARVISFTGTRRISVAVPAALAPPLAVRAFSVVGVLSTPALTGSGTIGVHDCTATIPGNARPSPAQVPAERAGTKLHAHPAANRISPSATPHSGGAEATASAG